MYSYSHASDYRQFRPVSELRWLFFDLNSYFASVEQQENPALQGRPVAVVPTDTDATSAIAASYEAKRYGITTGTKIYEAKKLCPELVCVQARHDVYVRYHHRILAVLEQFMPVTKVCSVDEAACLLFTNDRAPIKAHQLAINIKQAFAEQVGTAIKCSIGIAPNAYLAKIGTEIQKPDGLVILEPDQYWSQLFSLELTDLTGINQRMQQRLYDAEVYTIEDFCRLSPKHARRVWGSVAGEQLWYRLHGYDIPEQATTRRMIGHSRVLDPDIRSIKSAFAMLRNLTIKAAARLRRLGFYARRLNMSVKGYDHFRWSQEQVFTPTQSNFVFLDIVTVLWQQMLVMTQVSRLKSVSISLYDLSEAANTTLDLFDTPEQDDGLSETLDRIKQRFGADSIQVGSCPKTTAGYVGTKIAFNRIPDDQEFLE